MASGLVKAMVQDAPPAEKHALIDSLGFLPESEITMVEKCANPACAATFRSLRDGRVFVEEAEVGPREGGRGQSWQFHYYWLCNYCCRTMTVITDKGKGLKVVLLPTSATAVRAAS